VLKPGASCNRASTVIPLAVRKDRIDNYVFRMTVLEDNKVQHHDSLLYQYLQPTNGDNPWVQHLYQPIMSV
jgi:hypothetical protein